MTFVAPLKSFLKAAFGRALPARVYAVPKSAFISKERFGSESCGWDVIANGLDRDSVVYSFGVGEDASFDLALIERFGLCVYAFDPTPRSILWVKKQRFPKQFRMQEYGISAFDGTALFAPPENPDHVSFSIVAEPSQNAVSAPVKRLTTIMSELGHDHIDILKMDIEGAEYAVISDICLSTIRPRQILVEFHHRFHGVGVRKTRKAIDQLRSLGYQTFSASNEDFCFIRSTK